MYARQHAENHPDKPAIIMGTTGECVTFAEFEARANRVAQLLRVEVIHDDRGSAETQ